MTLRTNTAEGGTNGTAVTSGNSGGASGDAFGTVSAGAGGSITYTSAAAAQGSLSIEFAPASAVLCYAVLNDGATGTSFSVRVYVYLTGYPSSETIFVDVQGAAGGTTARLHLGTTGLLRLVNTAGSPVHTMSTPLALNTWHRIVLHGDVSASATVRYAVYPSHQGVASEAATVNAVNTLNGSGSAGRVVYGRFTATGTMTAFRLDGIAQDCQSGTEIGPFTVSPLTPTAVANGSKVGGAATIAAGLADADDATGAQMSGTIGDTMSVTLGSATTPGLPAGTVGIPLRLHGVGGAATVSVRLYAADGVTPVAAAQSFVLTGTAADVTYGLSQAESDALVNRCGLVLKLTQTA